MSSQKPSEQSAFGPITTKYDLVEAKILEFHPIAPFVLENLALCSRSKPLKYFALAHGFASGLCGLTPFHFLDQDQENILCFWKPPSCG